MGTTELVLLASVYFVLAAIIVRAYVGVRRRVEYTLIRRIAVAVGALVALASLSPLGTGLAGDIRQPVLVRAAAFAVEALAVFVQAGVAFVLTLATLSILRWLGLAVVGWLPRPARQESSHRPSPTASAAGAVDTSIAQTTMPTPRLLPEVAREHDANAAAVASLRRHIDAGSFCGNCGRERDRASPVFCRFCGFRFSETTMAIAANERGVSSHDAQEVVAKLATGDRDGAIASVTAQQQRQREQLLRDGVDVRSIEPEIGKLIGWDQTLRHVFRVLDFDRSDTAVTPDGAVKAASIGRPYGYLRLESPILNQPVRMPIIHRDDFFLATTVFDEAQFAGAIAGGAAELLVTYAPQKVLAGGLSGTPQHCLHYMLCPRGTLERYYPNTPVGDRRMARPEPEALFGQFVYEGTIRVGVNSAPEL